MIPKSVQERAKKMYLRGYSRKDISVILNVPRNSVWRWTRKLLAVAHEFVKCEVCQNTVRRKKGTQRYCSRSCQDKAYYQRKKAKKQNVEI